MPQVALSLSLINQPQIELA